MPWRPACAPSGTKVDDFSEVVAEALDETARRWEREAAGRAEMQAMLDGPRRPFDPEATYQKLPGEVRLDRRPVRPLGRGTGGPLRG